MTLDGNYFSALKSLSTEASPTSTKASYAWQTPVCEQGHLLACIGFEFMKRATKSDLVIRGGRSSTEMANYVRRFYGQRVATSTIDNAPSAIARLLRNLQEYSVEMALYTERIHPKLYAAFLQCLHNDGLIDVSFDAFNHIAHATLTDEGSAWAKMRRNQAPDIISSWADEMDKEDHADDRSVSVNRASSQKLKPPAPIHID